MEFLPLIDEVLDAMQNIIQFDKMHFPCGLCEHNTDIKSETQITVLACYLLAEKLNSKNSVHGILIMVIADGILTQRHEMDYSVFEKSHCGDMQHVSNQIIYGDDASEEEFEEAEPIIPEPDSPSTYLDADVTKADVIIGVVYIDDVANADVFIDVDVHVAIDEKVPVNTIDEESCDGLSIYKI
ncbi:unnamed protein product [Mytilus coruscus]|uniref:Uncharacterized protein n=1 Tax=Mytilus coruscus TaxID=42192 RepID=A0A6J8D4M0_MYTCO|nr:unnamed protein product [Mytilus coruscus]